MELWFYYETNNGKAMEGVFQGPIEFIVSRWIDQVRIHPITDNENEYAELKFGSKYCMEPYYFFKYPHQLRPWLLKDLYILQWKRNEEIQKEFQGYTIYDIKNQWMEYRAKENIQECQDKNSMIVKKNHYTHTFSRLQTELLLYCVMITCVTEFIMNQINI